MFTVLTSVGIEPPMPAPKHTTRAHRAGKEFAKPRAHPNTEARRSVPLNAGFLPCNSTLRSVMSR